MKVGEAGERGGHGSEGVGVVPGGSGAVPPEVEVIGRREVGQPVGPRGEGYRGYDVLCVPTGYGNEGVCFGFLAAGTSVRARGVVDAEAEAARRLRYV